MRWELFYAEVVKVWYGWSTGYLSPVCRRCIVWLTSVNYSTFSSDFDTSTSPPSQTPGNALHYWTHVYNSLICCHFYTKQESQLSLTDRTFAGALEHAWPRTTLKYLECILRYKTKITLHNITRIKTWGRYGRLTANYAPGQVGQLGLWWTITRPESNRSYKMKSTKVNSAKMNSVAGEV